MYGEFASLQYPLLPPMWVHFQTSFPPVAQAKRIFSYICPQCDPNLDVYAVWVDTLDPNFPRIALFANRNIEVGEELTFDYQMSLDTGSSCSSPRKKEHLKCRCGAEKCRTFLF